MIVVKLMGGLGNQMFQYAIGRKLAILNCTKLKLDLSFINSRNDDLSYTIRDFELGVFDIKASHTNNFFKKNYFSRMQRALKKFKYISEPSATFHPQILQESGNLYIDGFWQSELYFKDIRDTLIKDFCFPEDGIPKNHELAHIIRNTNAVSVHIRRGDYISNSDAYAYHGVCSMDYYQKAIKLAATWVAHPVFYIFSDDINWVKSQLPIKFTHVYIDHNTDKNSYKDLQLMSLCQNHIIANSSFSWWGAWLNQNPGKKVIAPRQWFLKNSPEDILPQNWLRI